MALMIMVVHGHAFLLGQKIGMMARVIATSAIYQKVGWRGGGREEGGVGKRVKGGKERGGRKKGEKWEKRWEGEQRSMSWREEGKIWKCERREGWERGGRGGGKSREGGRKESREIGEVGREGLPVVGC